MHKLVGFQWDLTRRFLYRSRSGYRRFDDVVHALYTAVFSELSRIVCRVRHPVLALGCHTTDVRVSMPPAPWETLWKLSWPISFRWVQKTVVCNRGLKQPGSPATPRFLGMWAAAIGGR